MIWHLLRTPPLDGATNMAVDVALMERARRTGEGVLRAYGWASPTLSLGRNQRTSGTYVPAQLAARGIDVVRRPTGGRAILHWRELTYSVTAPVRESRPLREEYGRINDVLLCALRKLGVAAELAGGDAGSRPPDPHPCFAQPSAGEIVLPGVGGGKLVGSAQLREAEALLQHGSILLHDDQETLPGISGLSGHRTHAATVSAALGRDASVDEVADALFAAGSELLDAEPERLNLEEIGERIAVHQRAFRDSLWTWRR
jgi:lipoyl(octanoyl) transferase